MDFIVDKTFERIKFNESPIKLGDYENCIFKQCDFSNVKLFDIKFIECEFISCDLSGSVFENCDLESAQFENTIIEKVDFRTSFNYSIDPEINRIRKAEFSISEISCLLDKYDIEIDRSI